MRTAAEEEEISCPVGQVDCISPKAAGIDPQHLSMRKCLIQGVSIGILSLRHGPTCSWQRRRRGLLLVDVDDHLSPGITREVIGLNPWQLPTSRDRWRPL